MIKVEYMAIYSLGFRYTSQVEREGSVLRPSGISYSMVFINGSLRNTKQGCRVEDIRQHSVASARSL